MTGGRAVIYSVGANICIMDLQLVVTADITSGSGRLTNVPTPKNTFHTPMNALTGGNGFIEFSSDGTLYLRIRSTGASNYSVGQMIYVA